MPAAAQDRPAAASYTWHEYNKDLLELNKRSLSGAYQQNAKHGPWDEKAVLFLDRMAAYFTYGGKSDIYCDVERPTHEKLVNIGQSAITAGCEDPLVAYCFGAVLHDSGQPTEALRHLRKAPAQLAELGYPDFRVWSAARRLSALEPDSAEGKAAKILADERIVRIACGKHGDVERRDIHVRLRDQLDLLGREEQVKLVERLRQQPNVDPWIVDTLDGGVEINSAWDKRGSGWAADVNEEGWTGFFEHLGKAQERLTRAWTLAPQLPEPASLMISVAMGGGRQLNETPQAWFERVEAAQLDYIDAYDRMFMALLPRWGGSHVEMYQLGLHAAQTKRFDTDTPWQLVQAVRKIAVDTGQGWAQLSTPGVYDQLCEVADAYAKFYQAKPDNGAWYRTFHAALAWRAGRYGESRQILDKLGGRADPAAFATLDAKNPSAATGQVYAMTGPNAAAVKRAEAAIQEKKWAVALGEFQKLHVPQNSVRSDPAADGAKNGDDAGAAKDAAQAKGDDRERHYYDQRIRMLSRRVMLGKGETITVQPDATLDGWNPRDGAWQVTDDGTLHGRLTDYKTPYFLFDEDSGSRYELSGVAGHTKGGARSCVLLAAADSYTWVVFYERTVLIHYRGGHKSFPRLRAPTANFVLRFDDGTLNVKVDGKVVVDNFQLPSVTREQPQVGLGVVDDFRGEAVFRDLTIRKLTLKDAPLEAKDVALPVDVEKNDKAK